jgi:uncharacterized SAM-binding protein YcdF (DUF218 family)
LAAIGLLALLVWCLTLYVVIIRFEGIPADHSFEKADAGIILGAQLWDNKPSPGLRERLDHGLKLYYEGFFTNFIVTGGLDNNGAILTEAEGMRDYLIGQGVPAEAIRMDSLSRSTYENLLFAREIMDRKGWTKAIIVTHSYHGSRAADTARTIGYKDVQVGITDSKVMNMAYHETREVLAYSKWMLEKWFR